MPGAYRPVADHEPLLGVSVVGFRLQAGLLRDELVEALGRLAEYGLTTCTLWLPIAAEHLEKAMERIAAEITPHLG